VVDARIQLYITIPINAHFFAFEPVCGSLFFSFWCTFAHFSHILLSIICFLMPQVSRSSDATGVYHAASSVCHKLAFVSAHVVVSVE